MRGAHGQLNRMAGVSHAAKNFTPKQSQYLAFIHLYTRLHLACPCTSAVGVAIIAAILLAIGSPAVAPAATMEEVSRCRAMRNHIQRWDCFKSLKEGPKAKATDAPKAGAEEFREGENREYRHHPQRPRMPLQPPPLLIILASHPVSPFVWITTRSPRSFAAGAAPVRGSDHERLPAIPERQGGV